MKEKNILRPRVSPLQKIARVFLGLILTVLLLEAGLRLGGFVLLSIQEYVNFQSIKQKGTYRILCLGESTTQGQYPHLLEKNLNERNMGIRFSVIDKGLGGTDTSVILSRVESYLAEYHPDMVVAMMGCNDQRVKYYEDIPDSETWLFRHCRAYRFVRMLYMQLLKKIKVKGPYRSSGPVYLENAKPEKTRVDLKKSDTVKGFSANKSKNLCAKKSAEGNEARNASPNRDRLSEASQAVKFVPPSYPVRGESRSGHPDLSTEESIHEAIEQNSENDNTYVELGRMFQHQGKSFEAENAYRKAIELNPKNDAAYAKLGQLYNEECARLGQLNNEECDVSKAEDCFKKATELNPKNDEAFAELGVLYQHRGRLSEAEDLYRKAILLATMSAPAYTRLGLLYERQGKFSEAEGLLRKALEIDPKNELHCVILGRLCQRQGKFSEAEDCYIKAMKIDPRNDYGCGRSGKLDRIQDALPQDEEVSQEGIPLVSRNLPALQALISLYEEIGKPELAKEYAKKTNQVVAEDPLEVTVHNYRTLKGILDSKGIRLVCVQYPMRNVEPLKKIFWNNEGAVFVDNERIFKEAVKQSSCKEYFIDMFAGDFGHCTQKGNMLLAQNIADVILREVFNK